MLTAISLQNFKIFQEKVTFPIRKINLFTGINGGGKSTVLQSLLMMRQSEEHGATDYLLLNGSCVELGTFLDLKNSDTPTREAIKLAFIFDASSELSYELVEDVFDDSIAKIKNSSTHEAALNNAFSNIHYVAADRIGPKPYYEKSTLGKFPNVGARGEHTANILYRKKDDLVPDALYRGNDAKTLIQQTEEWLSCILGGAKLELRGTTREHTVLNLLMNTRNSRERYRPSNVGFGYAYILPIIVSGLIAKPNEILIIENPEAHLHPKAQSELTKFLALVASGGVQVFIESHSEHILNALRVAALRTDMAISNTDISVLYFQQDHKKPFVHLEINEKGKIDNWVDGFFDQQELDLSEIFKLSKKIK